MKQRSYIKLKAVASIGKDSDTGALSLEELTALKQSYDRCIFEMNSVLKEYKDLLADLVDIRDEFKKRFNSGVYQNESD